MNIFLKALPPVFFLALAACGSSSGGGSTGPDGATSLSAEEFARAFTTGVVRVDVDVDFTGPSNTLDIDGTTYTVNVTGKVESSQVLSVTAGASSVTTDNCSLTGPEVDTGLTGPVLDDSEVDFSSCTDTYFKISDAKFRVEFSCSELIPDFAADFTYISDKPPFDLGELSMDFGVDSNDDLTAGDGVCGSVFTNQTVTRVTPPGLIEDSTENEAGIEIVAPYVNGNRVRMDFSFSDFNLAMGEYNIVNRLSGTSLKEVTLVLSSTEFGGTPEFPTTIDATGGVVTITAVSELSYSGTFNVSLDNGDTLTGTFTLTLR